MVYGEARPVQKVALEADFLPHLKELVRLHPWNAKKVSEWGQSPSSPERMPGSRGRVDYRRRE